MANRNLRVKCRSFQAADRNPPLFMSTLDPTPVVPGNFLLRLFFIVVYLLILSVIRFVLWGVLLVQMVFHLFTGRVNAGAQKTGQTISEYIYRIWLFLSYNTNERPFPFRSWRR